MDRRRGDLRDVGPKVHPPRSMRGLRGTFGGPARQLVMHHLPDWATAVVDAAILVPFVILFVRITGLRSFAKMSAYDFAVTVAIGSTLATTVLDPRTPWWQGATALAALLGVQWLIGLVRYRVPGAEAFLDNRPRVLVREGRIDSAAMRRNSVTEGDLRQKLRGAGLASVEDAALVVLETTGDVTVMTVAAGPSVAGGPR